MGLLDYEDRYGNGVSTEQAVQAVKDAISNGEIAVPGGGGGGVDPAQVQALVNSAVAAAVPAGGMVYLGDWIGQACTPGTTVRWSYGTWVCRTATPSMLGRQVAVAEIDTPGGEQFLPLDPATQVGDYLLFMGVSDGSNPSYSSPFFTDPAWSRGPGGFSNDSTVFFRMWVRTVDSDLLAAGGVALPINACLGTVRVLRMPPNHPLKFIRGGQMNAQDDPPWDINIKPLLCYYLLVGDGVLNDPAAENVVVQRAHGRTLTTLLKHDATAIPGVNFTGDFVLGARGGDQVGGDFPSGSFQQIA